MWEEGTWKWREGGKISGMEGIDVSKHDDVVVAGKKRG